MIGSWLWLGSARAGRAFQGRSRSAGREVPGGGRGRAAMVPDRRNDQQREAHPHRRVPPKSIAERSVDWGYNLFDPASSCPAWPGPGFPPTPGARPSPTWTPRLPERRSSRARRDRRGISESRRAWHVQLPDRRSERFGARQRLISGKCGRVRAFLRSAASLWLAGEAPAGTPSSRLSGGRIGGSQERVRLPG